MPRAILPSPLAVHGFDALRKCVECPIGEVVSGALGLAAGDHKKKTKCYGFRRSGEPRVGHMDVPADLGNVTEASTFTTPLAVRARRKQRKRIINLGALYRAMILLLRTIIDQVNDLIGASYCCNAGDGR